MILPFLFSIFKQKNKTEETNGANYRALDVASYFIFKSTPLTNKGVCHLKLQNLCYYAQAWHLALHDTPLFIEPVYVWLNGGLVDPVYEKYHEFGWKHIQPWNYEQKLFDETILFLDQVWEAYGCYDRFFLAELMHNEEPWQKARNLQSSHPYKRIAIEENEMKLFYRNITIS